MIRLWLGVALLTGALAPADSGRAQEAPRADSVAVASPADSVAVSQPDTMAAVPLRDVGDVLARIFRREVRTEIVGEARPGLSFTLLPGVGYNPSYGAFIGISVALGGWLGDRATTSASSGSVGGSYSTTEQISLYFRSDFYLPDNTWAFKGDWRYLDTSQPTFGLGEATPDRESYPMDFVLYRLHQVVYKRMGSSQLYAGPGYHFDRYDQIRDTRAEQGEPTPFSVYSGGTPSRTQSVAVSANVLIDTRDNSINAAHGLMWNASLRSYQRVLGSDGDRQSLWSDFRSYTRLPRDSRNVLAIWNYLWFTFGKAPYLDLPATGWDTYGRSGRGYLQGHIRGPDQIYIEFEYRLRFTRNDMWGGVTFVNLTNTTGSSAGPFGSFDTGGGAGLRLKFNKKTNTNLSVDAAVGQDGKMRLFFGLQEVF